MKRYLALLACFVALSSHAIIKNPPNPPAGAPGSGTVTQVGTGTGLTGGPIDTSGTVSLAPIASGTILGNSTGSSAAPSPNSIQNFVGQYQALSRVSGVTCESFQQTTGLTDSTTAVLGALTAVAGTNTTLLVDCPVYLQMGIGSSYSIFVSGGTNLTFTGTGQFILDSVGAPAFVFDNASNITWTNTNFFYIGQPGLVGIYFFNTSSFYALYSAFNNTTVTSWLAAHNGNTFQSGGYAISNGQTNANALVQIRGASNNINFVGASIVAVPIAATAAGFVPAFVSFGPDWNTGFTNSGAGISSSTTPTTANSSEPSNITFDGWTVDGVAMGFVGGCSNCTFRNIKAYRYSDLEDGTSGTVTFSGVLTGGATTGTLAAPWAGQTASYGLGLPLGATTGASGTGSLGSPANTATITFSGSGTIPVGSLITVTGVTPQGYNGTYAVTASSPGSVSYINGNTAAQTVAGVVNQVVSALLTQGQTGTGAFVSGQNGGTPNTSASVANTTSSAVAISGWAGGMGTWFSPPHLFYMNVSSTGYPFSVHISDVTDYGSYVGTPLRRPTGSGMINSLKLAFTNGSTVDRYQSYRPDGPGDIYAGNGGVLRDFYSQQDTSLSTLDGSTVYGLRFPNSTAYTNLVLEKVTLIDVATVPTAYPFGALASVGNNNISIKGLKVIVNDWPTGATYYPGIDVQGNSIDVQADLYFNAANSSQTGRGSLFENASSPTTTNSNFDITVHGWRQLSLTFTAAPNAGDTTATLANAFGNFSTSTYKITLPDGEIRYATLTANTAGTITFTSDGSTTMPLAAKQPSATAVAVGTLNATYAQYKQRIILADNGLSTGNHAIVRDLTNGWEGVYEDGLQTEHYTQMWAGNPQGSVETLPIVFPSTMAIDRAGYRISTNLNPANSLTTIGVGCASSPTALLAAQLATTSFTPNPAFAPTTACGANPILLTPAAGTYVPTLPSVTTATSGDGVHATVTFTAGTTFTVGQQIVVAGVAPGGYNGTYTVTASSSGSVSYASTATGSQTTAGTVVGAGNLQVSVRATQMVGAN